MPESEPKPKLIELVAPGAGQGWKAVLKSGKAVIVHEIPVPAAEAAAAIPRIQRLFEHRHPSLSPVMAWGTDPNGLWVAVEPNEGTPLGTILSRGPLTPPAAAALGAGLLSGVSALHEAGISMGGFGASAVRVNGNGEVRLSGHPLAAARGAPSQSDLRADVRSSGMAICAAFGVDPAGAPAPPNIPPGLVVTMRSMASGAMGPAADRAQGALREMASALLAPDRLVSSQAELALRAGGREMPPITPFLPKTEAPPAAPPAPREETPLPRAASYDAPPRPAPPEPTSPWTQAPQPSTPPPQPSTPPTPSPFATPASPASPAPAPPPPQAANPPAPAPPYLPPAPVPAPAPPYVPPAPAPAPYVPPPAEPVPYVPPPASPYKDVEPYKEAEPPHAPYFEPVTPAPRARPTEPTWTPASSSDLPTFVPAGAESAPATTPPERKSAVARRPVDRGASGRPSWMMPAIVAVAILVILAIAGGIFLAERPSSTTGRGTPTPTPSSKQSPKPSPSPTGVALLPIPDYGPTVNPPLTSVKFCSPSAPCVFGGGTPPATDTNCTLGGPCHVDFAAYWSGNTVNTLTFSIQFFDRCNNPNKTSTTVLQRTDQNVARYSPIYDPAPAGGIALTLPSGVKAAVLVAIADTGTVKAASAPFPLGAESCA